MGRGKAVSGVNVELGWCWRVEILPGSLDLAVFVISKRLGSDDVDQKGRTWRQWR